MRRVPQGPLNANELLAVYQAVVNNDVDYIQRNIINYNLENVHCNFSDFSDVPGILKNDPPLISVAAYFGREEILNILLISNASIDETDRIFFLFFLIMFYLFFSHGILNYYI